MNGAGRSARESIPSYENVENAGIKLTKAWGETADLTLSYSVFSGRYKSKIFNYKNTEPDETKPP